MTANFDSKSLEIEGFFHLPIFPASAQTPIHQKSKVGR